MYSQQEILSASGFLHALNTTTVLDPCKLVFDMCGVKRSCSCKAEECLGLNLLVEVSVLAFAIKSMRIMITYLGLAPNGSTHPKKDLDADAAAIAISKLALAYNQHDTG